MNVRSDSLMDGYLSPDRVQPADVDADGWMATSDVGFAVGNRLAVVGRSDEAIVALGRKIYPIDVERAVASALGDQRMLPVAFGVTDSRGVRDRIVVAVATRKWSENQRRAAELAVVAETGVRAAAVLSVPPSAIPRTTSGKVRRDELARLYVESPRDLSGGTG